MESQPARAHPSSSSSSTRAPSILPCNTSTSQRAMVVTSPVAQLLDQIWQLGALFRLGKRTDTMVCRIKIYLSAALHNTAGMDWHVQHYIPEWRGEPGCRGDSANYQQPALIIATSSDQSRGSSICENHRSEETQRSPPNLFKGSWRNRATLRRGTLYVDLEPISPFLDQIMSLETCLRNFYSVNLLQSSIHLLK